MNRTKSSGFWIVNCNTTVKSFISRCVTCRHLKGNLQLQKMASQPSDRRCEEPPFTDSGVDLFGLFAVKGELKRYRTLFTCLSSQTTHIEAANSLSTYCFLMCLRRFIGQRGNVRLIRSDNRTNFVWASAELTKVSQKWTIKKTTSLCKITVVSGCPGQETCPQLATWVVCGRGKSDLPEGFWNPP